MSDITSSFDFHKTQLALSLNAVADSMRACADMVDSFANLVNSSNLASDALQVDGITKGKRKAATSPEEGEGAKKRKRNTKPKDPNAPKRPASSYIMFQNEVRKAIKEQHPDITNAELMAMIAEQWRNMSDEKKETYNQAMKHAKEQYSQEKAAYDNRSPEEVEAANAATAAAAALKKSKPKARAQKAATATPSSPAIPARPPPLAQATSPSASSDVSDDEEEDEDEEEEVHREKETDGDSDSSEEEEQPAPKKGRTVTGVTKPASRKAARKA